MRQLRCVLFYNFQFPLHQRVVAWESADVLINAGLFGSYEIDRFRFFRLHDIGMEEDIIGFGYIIEF